MTLVAGSERTIEIDSDHIEPLSMLTQALLEYGDEVEVVWKGPTAPTIYIHSIQKFVEQV